MRIISKFKHELNFDLTLYRRLLIIFTLGISSGIPLAISLSTVKLFLYEKGASIELIGFIGVISIAYSIKFLFAPFLDSIKIPKLSNIVGFRKSWIITSQIIISLSIVAIAIFGYGQGLFLVVFLTSLVATASACQDVVIDGYRIELFDKRDQGLAASFYIFGYRIGLLLAGGFALYLADIASWRVSFLATAGIIMIICCLTFLAEETKKELTENKSGFKEWFFEFVLRPLSDFTKNNRFVIIAILILSFKLADSFAGSLSLPFFVDIGYTKTQIAKIVKTFGIFATLFGVFAGGLLIKKIGIFRCLIIATIIQSLSNLTFAYLSTAGNDEGLLYVVIFIENFSGGIGDAVFVAYLSSLCNIRFSATQYAILTSVASVSRSLLASSSGLVVASVGWYQFFIFSTFLALPTLVCLYIIYKDRA